MLVYKQSGALLLLIYFCCATAPISDDRIFISFTGGQPLIGPLPNPDRNEDGTCKVIHDAEMPSRRWEEVILQIEDTVPIIVDAQNDFSDDFHGAALPVPNTGKVIDVINSMRRFHPKKNQTLHYTNKKFPAIIRTEDTHLPGHFSFAESEHWDASNLVPEPEPGYVRPKEKSLYEFSVGCKVEDSIIEQIKSNQKPQPGHAGDENRSGAIVKVEHDMTHGVLENTMIDLSQFNVYPLEGSNPPESFVVPLKKQQMWVWPKHCIFGTPGHKSNIRLETQETDVVVPKGYYTFIENLSGQMDCDANELGEPVYVDTEGRSSLNNSKVAPQFSDNPETLQYFKRINLTKYLINLGKNVKNILLYGFAFEYCVTETALSIAQIKTEDGNPRYSVYIVTDGVGYLTAMKDGLRKSVRKKLKKENVRFVNSKVLKLV